MGVKRWDSVGGKRLKLWAGRVGFGELRIVQGLQGDVGSAWRRGRYYRSFQAFSVSLGAFRQVLRVAVVEHEGV